jgi:orotidine-5'-phosphate decarboxylase
MPPVSPPTPFGDRLAAAVEALGAPLAVGLDPHLPLLPAVIRARFEGLGGAARRAAAAAAIEAWSIDVIDALVGHCAAVKLQAAFYEQLGWAGAQALEASCARARAKGLLVILDAKRGDIDTTAEAYAAAALDPEGPHGADAVTVSPWMGMDTLEPFLRRCVAHGAGVFALVRTSNPGSGLLQTPGGAALRLAQALHTRGEVDWAGARLSSLGAVVGATIPVDELGPLRAALPRAWFLMPGVGAQGGSLGAARAAARPDGLGVLPVASRSVLFPPAGAPDPGAAWAEAVAERAAAHKRAAAAAWAWG